MSIIAVDYLPFDYRRYAQEIIPALQRATEGDGTPLLALLQSATDFSFGPRSRHKLPLSDEAVESLLGPYHRFKGLLDIPALHRIKAGEALNPWQYLATIIPSLEGRTLENLGQYGSLLQFHMFYTFCCEPPPPPWKSNSPVLPHDEPVFDWHSYSARDEETQTLWGAFRQLAPPDLAQRLHLTNNTDKNSFYPPRSLGIGEGETVTGFITLDEAQKLIDNVRTHETPLLASIIYECIRDGEGEGWIVDTKLISEELPLNESGDDPDAWAYAVFERWMAAHPAKMKAFLQRYYENLWQVEDEILRRTRYAISQGWGMLKTYYS